MSFPYSSDSLKKQMQNNPIEIMKRKKRAPNVSGGPTRLPHRVRRTASCGNSQKVQFQDWAVRNLQPRVQLEAMHYTQTRSNGPTSIEDLRFYGLTWPAECLYEMT